MQIRFMNMFMHVQYTEETDGMQWMINETRRPAAAGARARAPAWPPPPPPSWVPSTFPPATRARSRSARAVALAGGRAAGPRARARARARAPHRANPAQRGRSTSVRRAWPALTRRPSGGPYGLGWRCTRCPPRPNADAHGRGARLPARTRLPGGCGPARLALCARLREPLVDRWAEWPGNRAMFREAKDGRYYHVKKNEERERQRAKHEIIKAMYATPHALLDPEDGSWSTREGRGCRGGSPRSTCLA